MAEEVTGVTATAPLLRAALDVARPLNRPRLVAIRARRRLVATRVRRLAATLDRPHLAATPVCSRLATVVPLASALLPVIWHSIATNTIPASYASPPQEYGYGNGPNGPYYY